MSERLSAESVAGNQERWRQKILAEMGLTYRALAAGPVDWQAFEVTCRGLERYAWRARNDYVCPNRPGRGHEWYLRKSDGFVSHSEAETSEQNDGDVGDA